MANHVRPITVTKEDRTALERLVRAPTTPAGLRRRARAVLLMADGLPGTEIAIHVGADQSDSRHALHRPPHRIPDRPNNTR